MVRWFNNLKIGTRLIIGFVIIAVIAAAVGVAGVINIKAIDNADTQLYEKNTLPLSYVGRIAQSYALIRVYYRDLIMDRGTGSENNSKYVDKIKAASAEMDKNIKNYNSGIEDADEQKTYDELKAAAVQFSAAKDRIVSLATERKYDEATAVMRDPDVVKYSAIIEDSIGKLQEINEKAAKEKSDRNTDAANDAVLLMIILVAVALIIGIVLGTLIARSISKPLNKAVNMIGELAKGHLGMRLKIDTRDEIGVMAASMDGFADDLQNVVIATMQKIAEGDVNIEVTAKDDKDEITPALKKMIASIRGLVSEANILTKAAVEGRLNTRGDASKFMGSYREIVEGVNRTLDAVIGPLNVSADYVDKISKGEIPSMITDNYNGDFNVIKNNLNKCISNINALVADANMLEKAAIEGKLSTRADASKHGGDYRKIVEGVNKTLDAVIEPVKEAAAVLQHMSKGNLKVSVNGNYKGDHAEIKDALNFTINTISGYITEISKVLVEMAEGNLEVGIKGDYLGDFIDIKDSLNLIINSFNEVLGNINSSAEQVASGSRQVSSSSQALSQGATEQASSVEQITASLEEISNQTRQNAANANEANELANTAKVNAVGGNGQMKEMLGAMSEINDSSANISKIIKVIDEIAFQTNILALNAAVEAARAGQHGKGFAVVAEEVRNLAARSANAAKETTAMIEGSIKKVEAGTKIANDTALALNNIVDSVAKAAKLVGEIASASNEQAGGIAQVNQAILQVSQVVQTNSATSEEAAAASEELSSQAEVLKQLVNKFKIRKNIAFGTDFDRLNPEILKMLQGMKKDEVPDLRGSARKEAAASKVKISLSDNEFGKY